jgi:hypothetical protein
LTRTLFPEREEVREVFWSGDLISTLEDVRTYTVVAGINTSHDQEHPETFLEYFEKLN